MARLRFKPHSYKPKPQRHQTSASHLGPVNPRSTAAPKKSGFTGRLKSYAGTVGTIARWSPMVLSGFLSGAVRHLPDVIANAVPSLDNAKLLLGVGLVLFVAYEALKI